MATHSSVLAWRIPWTEKPGGLQSTGSQRVQHDWVTNRFSLVAQLVKNLPAMCKTWVRSLGWEDPLEKGKATPSSILAWEFHGLYSLWGSKESDTTEQLPISLSGFTLILPVFPLMSFFFFPVSGSNTESFWNHSSSWFTWSPSRIHLQMSVFSVQSLFGSPWILIETTITPYAPCSLFCSS